MRVIRRPAIGRYGASGGNFAGAPSFPRRVRLVNSFNPPSASYWCLASPGFFVGLRSLPTSYQVPRRTLPVACSIRLLHHLPDGPPCLILLASFQRHTPTAVLFALLQPRKTGRRRIQPSHSLITCFISSDSYSPKTRPLLFEYLAPSPLRCEHDADRPYPAGGSPASIRLSIMRDPITRWATNSTSTHCQDKHIVDRLSSICQALREHNVETGS